MSLYILMENSSSYFFETRRKQEIASIKSLNQKRIPTIVFENIEEVPEIFTDSKAVLLVTDGLNKNNEHNVKICNKSGIPVISLHDKSKKHYKYIYSSITDNDDITASMIYRYFKTNGKEKIAFFGFYANSESDVSKINAFYKVNLDFSSQDIFHIKSGFAECMNDFWEHRLEYDGIYFPNDFIAVAFLDYFRNNEPSYIEDRFFLGFSDTIIARLFHISVSSVTYTSEAIKSAVLQIYRCLTNNKNDFNCVSIDLKNILIPRDSTQKCALTNSDLIFTRGKRSVSMNFEPVAEYIHKSDPALKDLFILENLLLGLKTVDLLIIYMFLKGYSNSTTTQKLYLTPQSLNTHKNNYFKRTGCKDKAEFVKLLSKYISPKHLEEYLQYVSDDITDFSNY
ncbi:MAG: hypothetical protein J6B22_05615 [Clostridia bacterium]|nr:hypothetical protein [Clostridia bacterium]